MTNKRRVTVGAEGILAKHTPAAETAPGIEARTPGEFNVAAFEKRNREFMQFVLEKYLSQEGHKMEFEYRDFISLNYDALPPGSDKEATLILIDSKPIFIHYFENLQQRPFVLYSESVLSGSSIGGGHKRTIDWTKEKSYLVGIEDLFALIGGKTPIPLDWNNSNMKLLIPGMLLRLDGKWGLLSMKVVNSRIDLKFESLTNIYSNVDKVFLIKDKTP